MADSSIHCRDGAIAHTLEPLDAEDRVGSVNWQISLTYAGLRQSLSWSTQAWVMNTVLDGFEQALLAGCQATLVDMSSYPILRITVEDGQACLTLNPPAARQSNDGQALTARLRAAPHFPTALARAFKAYPRWW